MQTCQRRCKHLQQFAAVCSGLLLAARPLRGEPPPPLDVPPPARAGGAFGGGAPGEGGSPPRRA
eukprot:752303-Alexandrium_andersonii.AAC.1